MICLSNKFNYSKSHFFSVSSNRVLTFESITRAALFILFFLTTLSAFGQDRADLSSANVPDTIVEDSLRALSTNTSTSVQRDYGTERSGTTKNNNFLIGFGTFLLFGLVRFLYSKYIGELLAILSKSSLGRMTSHEGIWQNYMPRLLFILIYFLAGGYIIGRLIQLFGSLEASDFMFWIWGVIALFSVYLLKLFATHSVGLIFQLTQTVKTFFNHISVVNQLLGVILLPICGILMLVPDKFANILIILAGFVLLISLIFKGLINFGYVRNLPKVRFLYFILYLCIFEFIPLAVFARYVYNCSGV